MSWTLCSEELPELESASDSAEWEGWVWIEGWISPRPAVRTEKYFRYVEGDYGWFDITEDYFDRCKWSDRPYSPFDE